MTARAKLPPLPRHTLARLREQQARFQEMAKATSDPNLVAGYLLLAQDAAAAASRLVAAIEVSS